MLSKYGPYSGLEELGKTFWSKMIKLRATAAGSRILLEHLRLVRLIQHKNFKLNIYNALKVRQFQRLIAFSKNSRSNQGIPICFFKV